MGIWFEIVFTLLEVFFDICFEMTLFPSAQSDLKFSRNIGMGKTNVQKKWESLNHD